MPALTATADIPWDEAKQLCRQENARLAQRPQSHAGEYFVICTLYYTPLESGFTAERGFDTTPVAAPGLKGNEYGNDFLRAVKLEGYGRITVPVEGREYIAYDGAGRYAYDTAPKGRGITPLKPRESAAVKLADDALRRRMQFLVDSATVAEVFGNNRWEIIDTGGGLRRWQVDLYWGEDEPRAPDSLGRPRGTDFEYAYSILKLVAATEKQEK